MNIKTKFELGQQVYVKETRKGSNIDRIDIVESIDRREIFYHLANPWNDQAPTYTEDELTTEKPAPRSVFELTEDDDFYVLMPEGSVLADAFDPDWGDDRDVVAMGNAFLSEEEAYKEAERRRVHQELKKLANGCEFCVGAPNYHIVYEYGRNNFFVQNSGHIRMPDTVYFASEDDAWNAIRTIQMDRLMAYFGVGKK